MFLVQVNFAILYKTENELINSTVLSLTFLVCGFQYSLGVKRDEMRKLEEIAQAEEKKLELAEQYLEEDAAMFDEFLRENDKNSVDAIQVYVGCGLSL